MEEGPYKHQGFLFLWWRWPTFRNLSIYRTINSKVKIKNSNKNDVTILSHENIQSALERFCRTERDFTRHQYKRLSLYGQHWNFECSVQNSYRTTKIILCGSCFFSRHFCVGPMVKVICICVRQYLSVLQNSSTGSIHWQLKTLSHIYFLIEYKYLSFYMHETSIFY